MVYTVCVNIVQFSLYSIHLCVRYTFVCTLYICVYTVYLYTSVQFNVQYHVL